MLGGNCVIELPNDVNEETLLYLWRASVQGFLVLDLYS